MTKKDITTELIYIWKEEYEAGASFRKIGEKHGVSKATVGKHLTGVVTFREKAPHKKYADEWYELYLSGWSKSAIAKKYNVSAVSVGKILRTEKGVEMQGRKKELMHLLPTFKSLYQEGYDLTYISDKTGVSRQTILNYLNDAGVEIRSYSESSRKYEVDEEFFEEIDSAYKAYILGLVFSSGNLLEHYKSYSLSMVVKKDRVSILEEVFQALTNKKTEELLYVSADNCYKDRICSLKLYNSLKKLGLNFRSDMTFPALEEKYLEHFLKGYLKGSSSFASKRGYLTINSEPLFYESLVNSISSIIDIDKKYLRKHKYSTASITVYQKESVEKIKNFINS
ncbi:endonuclease [Bacillus cereus group sp. BfR-BA-02730]|uniref:endonuclease n=1 Tax=Bacillus cereus group sp. BfR-BA-02730 TaxID=3094893 RepID=UPI0029C49DD8|nr:endonuclease [Bacillus cereus group sp. BfR-BA-02730]MDX5808716.1 endonuclease [Bacillus cereus group sp. BfR-BA-02730]